MAQLSYDEQKFLSARAYLERFFEVQPDTPQSLLLAVKVESELGAQDLVEEYRDRLLEDFAGSDEAQQIRTDN